jgi:hypothetical protein
VRKEGEATDRGTRATREEATRYAEELAAADEPSKVTVENEGGTIAEERVFGVDAGLMPETEMSGGSGGSEGKA